MVSFNDIFLQEAKEAPKDPRYKANREAAAKRKKLEKGDADYVDQPKKTAKKQKESLFDFIYRKSLREAGFDPTNFDPNGPSPFGNDKDLEGTNDFDPSIEEINASWQKEYPGTGKTIPYEDTYSEWLKQSREHPELHDHEWNDNSMEDIYDATDEPLDPEEVAHGWDGSDDDEDEMSESFPEGLDDDDDEYDIGTGNYGFPPGVDVKGGEIEDDDEEPWNDPEAIDAGLTEDDWDGGDDEYQAPEITQEMRDHAWMDEDAWEAEQALYGEAASHRGEEDDD
jgi:hypothetical protein